jgi:hypothetical protein
MASVSYGDHVRSDSTTEGGVDALVTRCFRLVADGRGDVARGRNVFVLRFLDALWDEEGPLSVPYRPTRNPAAFLVMVFDLVGDAAHGYLARLERDPQPAASEAAIREHLRARALAPWTRLVDECRTLGLPHVAQVVADTVRHALARPSTSDLAAELERVRGWMTPAQAAVFDADAYVERLPLARVLTLLRFDPDAPPPGGREQHPTGGDLRSLLRRRLDAAWAAALADVAPAAGGDATAFLAAWPLDVLTLAGAAADDEDFAAAYAVATDAPPPGRTWPAAAPYVEASEAETFAALAGRGNAPDAAWTRRTTRLRRWGVSALLPATVAAVDRGLAAFAPALGFLAARMPWRQALTARRDALTLARRHALQLVADAMRPEAGTGAELPDAERVTAEARA